MHKCDYIAVVILLNCHYCYYCLVLFHNAWQIVCKSFPIFQRKCIWVLQSGNLWSSLVDTYAFIHTFTRYCTIGTLYSNEVKRNTFPFKTRLLHLIILSFLHLNSVPDIWFSFPVKNMNNFHALVFPFSSFFLNIFHFNSSQKYKHLKY